MSQEKTSSGLYPSLSGFEQQQQPYNPEHIPQTPNKEDSTFQYPQQHQGWVNPNNNLTPTSLLASTNTGPSISSDVTSASTKKDPSISPDGALSVDINQAYFELILKSGLLAICAYVIIAWKPLENAKNQFPLVTGLVFGLVFVIVSVYGKNKSDPNRFFKKSSFFVNYGTTALIFLSYSIGCFLLVTKIQNQQQGEDEMNHILQLFSMCIAFSLVQLLFPVSIKHQDHPLFVPAPAYTSLTASAPAYTVDTPLQNVNRDLTAAQLIAGITDVQAIKLTQQVNSGTEEKVDEKRAAIAKILYPEAQAQTPQTQPIETQPTMIQQTTSISISVRTGSETPI